MSYTRLADPQTAWARHLDRIRRDRNWSAVEMFEHAHETLGLAPKSINAFKPVLRDQEPPAAWVQQLADLYGWPEPQDEPSETPAATAVDVSALITMQSELLREQIEATRENTAMLAAVLAQITGQPQVDPRAAAAIQAQADAASRTSPHPQDAPSRTTGTPT